MADYIIKKWAERESQYNEDEMRLQLLFSPVGHQAAPAWLWCGEDDVAANHIGDTVDLVEFAKAQKLEVELMEGENGKPFFALSYPSRDQFPVDRDATNDLLEQMSTASMLVE